MTGLAEKPLSLSEPAPSGKCPGHRTPLEAIAALGVAGRRLKDLLGELGRRIRRQ